MFIIAQCLIVVLLPTLRKTLVSRSFFFVHNLKISKMSKNIDLLKQRLNAKTSEELFDITEQPPQQCPSIDNIIRDLEGTCKQIQSIVNDIKRTDNIEDIPSLAGDIDWHSSDIDKAKELNELRKQIELVRGWGEEWKSLAKSLLNNISKEEDIVHHFSSDFQIRYDELCGVVVE